MSADRMERETSTGQGDARTAPVLPIPAVRRPKLWVDLISLLLLFPIYNTLSPSPVVNYDNPPLEEITGAAQHGDNLNRIVIPLLAVVGVSLLVRNRSRIRMDALVLIPLVSFLAWIALTLAWSLDPSLSIVRYVSLLFMLLFAAGFAVSRDATAAAWFLVVFELLGGCAGLCFEVITGRFHLLDPEYRFLGLAPHPNVQGAFLASTAVALAWLFSRPGQHRVLLFGMAVVIGFLLLETKSRTSIAAAVVAISTFLTVSITRRVPKAGAAIVAALVMIVSLSCLLYLGDKDARVRTTFQGAVHRADDQGDPSQLSGRVFLWRYLLDYAERRPVRGYGFGSFWTPEHIEDVSGEQRWVIQQSHSGYLDMLLSLGLPGLLLFCALLLLLVRSWFRSSYPNRDESEGLWFALAVFFIVHSFTESIDVSSSFTNLVFYISLCALALRHKVDQRITLQPIVTNPDGRFTLHSH